MFRPEGKWQELVNGLRNRRYPEATMLNAFVDREVVMRLALSKQLSRLQTEGGDLRRAFPAVGTVSEPGSGQQQDTNSSYAACSASSCGSGGPEVSIDGEPWGVEAALAAARTSVELATEGRSVRLL